MGKEKWSGRKETHFVSPSDLVSGGERTLLSDDKGRTAEAWGRTREESREKAYQKWAEKHR